MATIVLRSVGQALGGPTGALVGSFIGASIDRELLGTPREGPRRDDLSVQGSSYGAPIPRIFGTMRVAGSVIWASDLIESEAVTGSKGQASQRSFNYSANLAVALSSRPIKGVGRIWADGKLIRGEAGDLKVGCTLRIHRGLPGQAIDPLIAAMEVDAPAYRGTALAVFEGLQLAEFGNRIPLLTFEVIADEGSPDLPTVLGELSDGIIEAESTASVTGYAAYGKSRRGAIAPLIDLFGLNLSPRGRSIREISGFAAIQIDEDSIGAAAGERVPRVERWDEPDQSLPALVAIDYYDDRRDYQAGRVSASSGAGRQTLSIDAPMVLAAQEARSHAERMIAQAFVERSRLRICLSPDFQHLRPGDIIEIDGQERQWRCQEVLIENGVTEILAAASGSTAVQVPADPGRYLGSPDEILAPTQLFLIDPPDLGQGPVAQLYVGAANSGRGWRSVPLEVVHGPIAREMASNSRETVMAICATALGSGSTLLIDRMGSVEVELVDPDHALSSATDDALMAGANRALVGEEVIQFGKVEHLGGSKYRLSRLLRGQRGSEWAVDGHQVQEPFVLLDFERLTPLPFDAARRGSPIEVTPMGLADDEVAPVSRLAEGEALRPPSPCHLAASLNSAGGLDVGWIARSPSAFGWSDGQEQAQSLNFRTVCRNGSGELVQETNGVLATFAASDLTTLGSDPIEISVTAMSAQGVSRPATITVSI